VKRIEDGKKTLAGHVEDTVAALRDEVVDQDAAAGAWSGHTLV
jgi:hypothetical protein